MAQETKKKGCLSLLIKGFVIYMILCGIFAMVMTNRADKEYEEALSETTALMDAGNYEAAIGRLDKYWEEHTLSNNIDLADLYIQCFEVEEKYHEAANIVLSIFREQGYESAKDGVIHTRLAEILPKLSQEEQENIQKVLEELPDSLEEKQALEKEQKKSAKQAEEQAKQEAEAQKAEAVKAAEMAEAEKKDRERLQSAFAADMTNEETRELCEQYLSAYPNSDISEVVTNIVHQFDVIAKNTTQKAEIGYDIVQEYEKVQNYFYGDYYINYKLEYAKGMSTLIGTIQDTLGEGGDYNNWVASNIDYFYDTQVPGDNIYVIRTQQTFPKAGGYSFCLIPDGTKKLSNANGFEQTVEVYREVSEDYIDAVYAQYELYQNAEANITHAYDQLNQLGNALQTEEAK